MSAHTQFLLLALASLLATAPAMVWAWHARLRHLTFATACYLAGYALIALAFIVDAHVNPPLFVHGFVPGIGIGLLLTALLILAQDARARRVWPPSSAAHGADGDTPESR
jgi:hypothetical protein